MSRTIHGRTIATSLKMASAVLMLLFGTTNCDKGADAEKPSAAPEAKPAATQPPLEVPTAQPPKLMDAKIIPPPSLAPELSPTAGALAPAPSAAAAAPTPAATNPTKPATDTTAAPKSLATPKGGDAVPTSPGPMAPRTTPTM